MENVSTTRWRLRVHDTVKYVKKCTLKTLVAKNKRNLQFSSPARETHKSLPTKLKGQLPNQLPVHFIIIGETLEKKCN